MPDRRLIEDWLPIAALSEEAVRERRSMTALPPIYYLHVWWARRPLVVSRAAVLASLLPADADQARFLRVIGIHGDPVAARVAIDRALRTGIRVSDPYGYGRAFSYCLEPRDVAWLRGNIERDLSTVRISDPTASGGSIPFEAVRLGLGIVANDINPVASLIMKATVEWPQLYPSAVQDEFDDVANAWRRRVAERLSKWFVQAEAPNRIDLTYLWARTVRCPYCEGVVPLSPNWRLASDGTGVRLRPGNGAGPGAADRVCAFEIVTSTRHQSTGTVARGDGMCPWADCGRVIDGDEIKA